MKEDKVFKARRDYLVLCVYFVLIAGIVAFALLLKRSFVFGVLLGICSLFLVLYTICVFNCKYVFKENYIFVLNGIFRRRIHYRNIEKISLKNSFCFPFISLKNIKISNGERFSSFEYVCPKDREAFVEELENRVEYAKNLTNFMELDNE